MKSIAQILIFILPILTFCQDETGKTEGITYNLIYTLIVPSDLAIKNGLAYRRIGTDTFSVPDSVSARFIPLGEKNKKTVDLAEHLIRELKKGAKFDSLALIHRTNRDQDISMNYTGWFTKGKMVPEFELFSFTQDTQNIGWVDSQFGILLTEILKKSEGKMELQVPVYDYSTPFTGKLTEYNSKGNIISVSNWKDGLRNGETIDYWDNGIKKIQTIFKSGKKWKYYKEWFDNEQIKMEVIYKNGKRKSSKVWNYEGELISNTNSKNTVEFEWENNTIKIK